MTSSEGAGIAAAAGDAPAPASDRRVLASGHLHPGMLFLRMVDGVRSAVFPALLALVTGEAWLAGLAIALFLIQMTHALARFLSFRYVLDTEELKTTEGILRRQERRIPVNRIQDMSFTQTLLRRLAGLVVVSVETASGAGAEATLDSLGRTEAEALREALHATKRARGEADEAAEPPAEDIYYRASTGELVLLGLTNNRIGAIIAALFGLWELSVQFGVEEAVSGLAGGLWQAVAGAETLVFAVLVAGMLLLALVAGWVLSITGTLILYGGFTLSLREDVFLRRFGLLTKRARSLPRRKIQRVLLEQSWLRRLLGVAVVRADSAGSGADEAAQGGGGRADVVVPLTRMTTGESLLALLLPDLPQGVIDWQRVSQRVILRTAAKGTIVAAAATAGLWSLLGPGALVALLIVPVSFGLGMLAYQNLGFAHLPGHLLLRWGYIGRYVAFVPERKVQAVVMHATPLDRMAGLARIMVYVAGGSVTALPHLPRDECEWLVRTVAENAAQSRFVW